MELGLSLPDVPTPIANFVPFRRDGDWLFLAGQICEWNGERQVSRQARRRARPRRRPRGGAHLRAQPARRAPRSLRRTLDRVTACLRVGGFVNCTPDYQHVPQVINGASDLIHELFGERGLHARTAIGVASLPQGAAVEVDAIFAID